MQAQITHLPVDSSRPPSTVLFESGIVRVGQFRCPIGHARFKDSGPTQSFCFVFPRTAVWIRHEGSERFVADANVIPLYNREHPYTRGAISPQGDRTDWFGVSPELLREALSRHDPLAAYEPEQLFRRSYCPSTPRIYASQRAVFDSVTVPEPADKLFVEEAVVWILEQVLRSLYGSAPPLERRPRHREAVEAARAHLAAGFARNESLSDIAGAVGVSVFHLCRLFRRLTGKTLHRYRGQLRLHSALERLAENRDDILTIANDLGYSGHSHFTAAFRTAFGASPSEWRRTAGNS